MDKRSTQARQASNDRAREEGFGWMHFRIYTADHRRDLVRSGRLKSPELVMSAYLEAIKGRNAAGDWRPLRLEVSEQRFDEVLDALH